jgi:hypothetical protein
LSGGGGGIAAGRRVFKNDIKKSAYLYFMEFGAKSRRLGVFCIPVL